MDFNASTVREAVDESIRLSDQLRGVDAGLVASARAVADRIDDAIATADGQELTKALYLIPHVTNLLREMLATPAARMAAGIAKENATGKLAQLRAVRDQQAKVSA